MTKYPRQRSLSSLELMRNVHESQLGGQQAWTVIISKIPPQDFSLTSRSNAEALDWQLTELWSLIS